MARTKVYALRDPDTKIRVSYRYRSIAELMDKNCGSSISHLEVYQTSQDLPRLYKNKR